MKLNFSSLSIYLSMALQPMWTSAVFQFLNLYIVGRTSWLGDQPIARPLPTHRTTQTQNKHIQMSMPQVGFEPMIPVFERTKTVRALDRADTVNGNFSSLDGLNMLYNVLILSKLEYSSLS
jgi:hypothetical protein